MKFYIDHTLKESSRRKCNYITCLFACFLVSLVCLVAKSAVSQASVIFLMLGEKEQGEMDIIINTNPSKRISNDPIDNNIYDNYFINFTLFENIMSNKNKNNKLLKTTSARSYYYSYVKKKEIKLILIDTQKEKEMELGRAYPFPKLKEGECLVHQSLINSNEKEITIEADLTEFIKDTLIMNYKQSNNISNINDIETYINFSCQIKDTFEDTFGKLGEDETSIVFMEMESFYKFISKFVPKKMTTFFPNYSEFLFNLNPKEYTNTIIANFPPNRINMYSDSDYATILYKSVQYANAIVSKLGNYENLSISMPLIKKMKRFNYGQVLLNLILNIIVICLFVLSFLLIYALLVMTIETNTFEFGILRLIGTTKKGLICLIVLQCLSFALPGFIFAFIIQFPILKMINSGLKNIVDTDLNLSYTNNSLLLAICVNFLSPILASIMPIRSILKKNISNSLNSVYNKTVGIKVEVISIEKKETNALITFGIITFLYGASIYYFLPLSMLSLNFTIMGLIFIWILLGIILGFIILSINIEITIQKALTYLLMFPFKKYIKILTLKNLTAHRLKNRKISIMYSLSISIFLLTMVSMDMILETIHKESLLLSGSEVLFISYTPFLSTPEAIKDIINKLYDKQVIENFGYITSSLNDICFNADIQIGNLGKNLYFDTYINGINSDYFSATKHVGIGIQSSIDFKNKYFNSLSPSEQLYLSGSKGRIGISAIFDWQFNANINENIFLKIISQNKKMSFLSKPAFLLDYAPGLVMNSQPIMMVSRDSVISIPFYTELYNKCIFYYSKNIKNIAPVNMNNVPIEFINLKLNSSKNENECINQIKNVFKMNNHFFGKLWFYANMKDRLNNISDIIFNVFSTITIIVLFFCFFNLTASMTINIFDQKKEIAIIRSLGLKKTDLFFVYISESVILILSASLIGTVIGTSIAYTMGLQWQMFMNVVTGFPVNIKYLCLLIGSSILGGIISTVLPTFHIMKISIADLIRNA